MKKFSRKEKIALMVFGVLLMAIIIQLIWRGGKLVSFSGGGIIPVEVNIDYSHNLLKPGEFEIMESSHNENNQSADKLTDQKTTSYWHVAIDRLGEPAWVTIDFGNGKKKTVRSLAALPRMDLPRQFFHQAELFGSNTGQDWKPISEIIQGERPKIATWRKWTVDNNQAYRYYKFLITNGHEGGKFYSMAELALFE